ncbi:MAG TPA: hypothetical protein VGL77_14370 [Armatimonadota bacterium]|jgi:hypothetical protein
MAEQASISLAVGDHVRLKSRMANAHDSYLIADTQVAFVREPADGLVLSIRDINSGRLVGETHGALQQYVIELLFDNTFNPKVASLRNAPRTAERPTAAPMWRRLRALLRDVRDKQEFISTVTPGFFAEGPLAKQLDGWKVIKVRSEDLSSLEKAESADAAGA